VLVRRLNLLMCVYYNIAHASALALARASRHSLIVYSDAFLHTGTGTVTDDGGLVLSSVSGRGA